MNSSWKRILTIAWVSAASVAAWAGIHPVPLDPKADSSTCVQCHEDKTKAKAVHTAISMGCTTCHEIRVKKDVTRLKLKTTTTVALCTSCHEDKKASNIKGRIHPPAVRDCVKCHDPHTSDNENQLLKATVGDSKDTNLCLTCHNTGVDVPKDGSRHPALDMGCNSCHTTHKTGPRGERQFDYHLTKDAPALCMDCHDVKDPNLAKAHQNQPFEKADCLTCHDPHQSKEKHLMARFTHNPFAAGMCDACHQPAKDGKVVLTAASPKEVCLTCHAEKGDQIEKSKVQHPGAMGDCTDCHSPHAGNSPYFPKPNPVAVCTGCHTDQGNELKKAHPHQPVAQEGCAICHDPHGNDNQHLLRAANVNDLCLECHGPDSNPTKLEDSDAVTVFGGKVKLRAEYISTIPVLPLKYGAGHPVPDHPISDLKIGNKVVKQMNCLTCHQPHSSEKPNLLVKDQEMNQAFCMTCHQAGTIGNKAATMARPTDSKSPAGAPGAGVPGLGMPGAKVGGK